MNLMLHVHALGNLKSALLLVGALNVLECRLIAKYSDDTKSSDLSLDTPPSFASIWWREFVNCVLCTYIRSVWLQLPSIEGYPSGKMELSITLARVFCLRMANLFALIVTLYSRLTKVHLHSCCFKSHQE